MDILGNQLNCAKMYFLCWEEFESNSRTKSRFHEKTKLTLSTDNPGRSYGIKKTISLGFLPCFYFNQ